MIVIQDLCKVYHGGLGADTVALDGISLTVEDGEFVAIMGPSGSGKSTLMNILGCLDTPTSGSYFLDGEDVATLDDDSLADIRNLRLGFVFQSFNLLPRATVMRNVLVPLLYSTVKKADRFAMASSALESAGLPEDLWHHKSNELSGGQMQRVAIGRALVREPAVTLMDEPLSSLDAKLRNDLRLELKRIQQDLGATLLYVTHDQTEAMTLANRIGVLERGALVQVGTPQQIYRDPVSSYVAARLGSPRINLLPRAAIGSLDAPAAAATIGVRPDAARLALANGHDSGHVKALVRRIEHLGDQKHVHVALGGSAGDVEVVTVCQEIDGLEPGRAISVEFTAPLFFDAAGQRIT